MCGPAATWIALIANPLIGLPWVPPPLITMGTFLRDQVFITEDNDLI